MLKGTPLFSWFRSIKHLRTLQKMLRNMKFKSAPSPRRFFLGILIFWKLFSPLGITGCTPHLFGFVLSRAGECIFANSGKSSTRKCAIPKRTTLKTLYCFTTNRLQLHLEKASAYKNSTN